MRAALSFADEGELVARARTREEAAIRTIIQRYNRRLYRIARGILRDDAEAEDALQEAFARAAVRWRRLRSYEAPEAWGLPRDREARPGLDEVLALRAAAQAMVRKVLEDLTDERLDTVPEIANHLAWPPPGETVRQCLSVVLDEEYAHRLFAERDLAVLESRG